MDKLKTKKCIICGDNFTQYNTTQKVCNWKCALQFASEKAKTDAIKKHRKEKRKFDHDAMTPSQWKSKLQTVFNTFIRTRDLKRGCVSCEITLEGKKFDAGHFWASTYEGIRFNEKNVHGQCVHCNQHKRSNAHEYRLRILNRITKEDLQWLEDHRHDPLKLTIPEIKDLIDLYKQKTKDLKNGN